AENPETPDGRCRVVVPARLREVASGCDAEFNAQMLEQDRHEVRNHDDDKERVAEFRASCQIRSPVAGVHVTDRHEKTRPGKSEQLPPKRSCRWNDNTAMNFGQRNPSRRSAPSGCRFRQNATRLTHESDS